MSARSNIGFTSYSPGLTSTSSFDNGLSKASATSLSNGRWLRPAKLVDQSLTASPSPPPSPSPAAVVGRGRYESFGNALNGGEGVTLFIPATGADLEGADGFGRLVEADADAEGAAARAGGA